MTDTNSAIRVLNLPEQLKYPIRVVASYISKGQQINPSDRLYTLEDADGNQFHLEFHDAGTIVENPVPVGSVFEQPLPVAYISFSVDPDVGDETTQASTNETPHDLSEQQHKTINQLIVELDQTARDKPWQDYRLSVENHLRANSVPFEDALRYSGDIGVKQRWQALNNAVNVSSASSPSPATSENKETNSTSATPTSSGTLASDMVDNGAQLPQVANNYFTFVFAIVAGAVATAIYAFLAKTIPLFFIGALIPFVFAWVAIMLAYMPIRGDRPSRIVICIFGAIVNLAVVWFINFWMIWNMDDAIEIFTSGPVAIMSSIIFLSENAGLEIGELTSSSNLEISGVFLLIIWGVEAIALSAAIFFGYKASTELQDVSAFETVGENMGAMKTEIIPLLGKMVLGIIKGIIPIILVIGAVYLLNEYIL